MPVDITNKLNTAVADILNDPVVKQRLDTLGAEPMKMSPAQFRTFVNDDLLKWTKVVKTSGATVD
jgi:tripartite-type tricarboxylate transporter receptor subunit TctC